MKRLSFSIIFVLFLLGMVRDVNAQGAFFPLISSDAGQHWKNQENPSFAPPRVPGLPVSPFRAQGFIPIPILCRSAACQVECNRLVDFEPGDNYNNDNNDNREAGMMSYKSNLFGQTKEGKNVTAFTLTNVNGIKATILDFGGVLYSLETPDRNGLFANISANLATIPEYQEVRPFFGSIVGRFANRIAKGTFSLDGTEYHVPINNGENALHGGLKGFDQKIWDAEPFMTNDGVGLKLTYLAKDGEEGYPGNLSVTVVYILGNDNSLTIDYSATTDKATPINLTNHTFWNLAGATSGSIRDHVLKLAVSKFLPTDDGLIPTGEVASVDGTPLDFRTAKPIGQDIDKITEPQFNGGYDHCLILDREKDKEGDLSFCAFASDPKTGRTMEIWTTEPAVQFYSGNFLDGTTGVGDYKYEKQSAFCLETQHYPDSPNHSEFPNATLRPGETYRHITVHKFGVE